MSPPYIFLSTRRTALQILTSCGQSSRWWWPGQRWAWVPQNWWRWAALFRPDCECDHWWRGSVPRCMRTCSCRPYREICECIPKVNTNQHVHVDMKQCSPETYSGYTGNLQARLKRVCVWERDNTSYMQAGLSVSWGNMHCPPLLQ